MAVAPEIGPHTSDAELARLAHDWARLSNQPVPPWCLLRMLQSERAIRRLEERVLHLEKRLDEDGRA